MKASPKTSPIRIRQALPEEAGLLSSIAIESKAYWGYSAAFMEACAEELTVTDLDIQCDKLIYAVAERNEQVVGYYALEWLSPSELELDALFVTTAHIGTGVGRALLEHAKVIAAARGAQRMLIQSDPNAERFYLAAGAAPLGRRESASIPGRYLPLLSIALNQPPSDAT
jgi:GNAT superfamily N-acetyltransferase